MKKIIVFISMLLITACALIAEDWGNPYFALFTNNTSIVNQFGSKATLKYIVVGQNNGTNAGGQSYSCWLINTNATIGYVSNSIYQTSVDSAVYTNARSSEMNHYWGEGDILRITTTNLTVTNEVMVIFSDVKH